MYVSYTFLAYKSVKCKYTSRANTSKTVKSVDMTFCFVLFSELIDFSPLNKEVLWIVVFELAIFVLI